MGSSSSGGSLTGDDTDTEVKARATERDGGGGRAPRHVDFPDFPCLFAAFGFLLPSVFGFFFPLKRCCWGMPPLTSLQPALFLTLSLSSAECVRKGGNPHRGSAELGAGARCVAYSLL